MLRLLERIETAIENHLRAIESVEMSSPDGHGAITEATDGECLRDICNLIDDYRTTWQGNTFITCSHCGCTWGKCACPKGKDFREWLLKS